MYVTIYAITFVSYSFVKIFIKIKYNCSKPNLQFITQVISSLYINNNVLFFFTLQNSEKKLQFTKFE